MSRSKEEYAQYLKDQKASKAPEDSTSLYAALDSVCKQPLKQWTTCMRLHGGDKQACMDEFSVLTACRATQKTKWTTLIGPDFDDLNDCYKTKGDCKEVKARVVAALKAKSAKAYQFTGTK